MERLESDWRAAGERLNPVSEYQSTRYQRCNAGNASNAVTAVTAGTADNADVLDPPDLLDPPRSPGSPRSPRSPGWYTLSMPCMLCTPCTQCVPCMSPRCPTLRTTHYTSLPEHCSPSLTLRVSCSPCSRSAPPCHCTLLLAVILCEHQSHNLRSGFVTVVARRQCLEGSVLNLAGNAF